MRQLPKISIFAPAGKTICVGSKNDWHLLELSRRSLSACIGWRDRTTCAGCRSENWCFFVRHAWSACAFKQVLCDGLLVDFHAVFSAFFQNGWFFQMHYLVLIFVARWRHNFREIAVKIAKSPKRQKSLCTPLRSGVFRGACARPRIRRTAVIFVTILGLFLAPFRDKIAATSNLMHFLAKTCSKMRLQSGLRPGPCWGAYSAPPALPTCLLLTHVALCQHVRGVIARTRYINVLTCLLTYLLTYISTIGCANFGPDWPLLFKVHEIWSVDYQKNH